MILYPLKFKPILKEKVWGGTSLSKYGKTFLDDIKIGESWELSDLPDNIKNGKSIIDNGPLEGTSLHNAIKQNPHYMGDAALINNCFPLLIKFLDATDNLSVQVHPSEQYAKEHPDVHLKSEAWIILDVEEGGCIYVGLKSGTTEPQLRKAIASNSVPDYIQKIPVKQGDCYYLPSGTCHALGKGIVVAEIQTASDTTFRIWDWGREDREMHIEEAMRCIDFSTTAPSFVTPEPLQSGDFSTTSLVDTPFFSVEKVESTVDTELTLETNFTPQILMVVGGRAIIKHEYGFEAPLGTTVLLPAGLHVKLTMPKGTALLQCDLPGKKRIA